ncbi:MAG: aspartate aminotransferase family protein [bacterium]
MSSLNQEYQKYRSRTGKSLDLYTRASRVMAGGVSHNLRYFAPYPCYLARAEGPRFWDVDGNEYLDFWMGHYLNILGHTPWQVTSALERQVREGVQWGIVHELQIELAEIVSRLIPSAEKVRFCCSGTEAVIYARRLARAFTDRQKFIKMEGSWHGAGTHSATIDNPDLNQGKRGGACEDAIQNTVLVRFNDTQEAFDRIREHADDLAAVIMEPILGEGGFIPGDREFLKVIREETQKAGALLIFDEIITGFRVGLGGAQGLYNITPDLTTLGKILGGGMPIGAVAGRADIMELCSPTANLPEYRKTLIGGGTFSCAPLCMTAGIAMLRHLEENAREIYPSLEAAGIQVRGGIERAFARHGIAARCTGIGSLFMTHFPKVRLEELKDSHALAVDCDLEKREKELRMRLLNKGVFVMHGGGAISTAHTPADLMMFLEKVEEVAQDMAEDQCSQGRCDAPCLEEAVLK